ncbi:glycoside hydrolase family 3 C-terminal domain-containing protein [Tessaracoccus palaemonis]|uniref:glycoside hydrolase family 3 C-terminal domain-containing protein n=1 Tax=Tessaracoccus palaemonis TaxID=2829499 RepID=UPI0021039151|nr:glycoside hydrolase family 3 C-terminal domain-containing protein [Tessaracoccus palaemonis]
MTDITDLTLEEKASLTSGADFWTTKAVDRLGVASIMMTDGPHGLRKQSGATDHLGLAGSVPATCFPPAVALASTWDAALAERVGEALGVESAIEDVAVILGPGINIKRSPLCGRNFEYLSEDPLVAGVLGSALVRGIQSKGVGASLKHFAANNQETDRMRASSDVDPRTLREMYLRAFERVVSGEQPWTVMCSYNRINGVYASEDPWLLTDVLRGEWGFAGLVVSDWGAVNDRVVGLPAGLDLEMPSSGGRTDAQLVAAVREQRLSEAALDLAASRVLDLVAKAGRRPVAGPLDVDAHHALAREAAARAVVLLKNDGGLLPLRAGSSVAVIGEFARTPRYQGAGSSLINPTRLDPALDALAADADVTFAPGFTLDDTGDAASLCAEAVAAAAAAEVAVVFLGLPAVEESEGYDRTHIDLPAVQLETLAAVRAANPNVVVVLSNGGVVALPFRDDVPAILEGWLLGQAGGSATADVLFGRVNPSGRLAETIPLRLEDNPSYGSFPGEFGHVRYGEGILVGYRGYDAKRQAVAYPFGHGLSYTTFSYSEPSAVVTADGDVDVTVLLTNTGTVAGREVVQVYVGRAESAVQRPPRALAGFASVELAPGQSTSVTVRAEARDLAYWDVRVDRWIVEPGAYTFEVGASSRDLRGSVVVELEGDQVTLPISLDSTIGELADHPVAGAMARQILEVLDQAGDGAAEMMASVPIGRVATFPGMPVTLEQVRELIDTANADL